MSVPMRMDDPFSRWRLADRSAWASRVPKLSAELGVWLSSGRYGRRPCGRPCARLSVGVLRRAAERRTEVAWGWRRMGRGGRPRDAQAVNRRCGAPDRLLRSAPSSHLACTRTSAHGGAGATKATSDMQTDPRPRRAATRWRTTLSRTAARRSSSSVSTLGVLVLWLPHAS
jgi:hypothetical protein